MSEVTINTACSIKSFDVHKRKNLVATHSLKETCSKNQAVFLTTVKKKFKNYCVFY